MHSLSKPDHMKALRRAWVSVARSLLFILIATHHSFPQDDQIRFQRLGPQDIPCPWQIGLVQCRFGFIWIAEQKLWRYDGNTFAIVTPDSSGDSLLRSRIWKDIIGGRHGVLGLHGSDHKFVLYDIAANRARAIALPAPEGPGTLSRISCATEDSRGRFLIGTEGGRVYRLNSSTLQLETVVPSGLVFARTGDVGIRDMLEDSSGTLWIGTPRGVMNLGADGARIGEYTATGELPRKLPSDDIDALALGHDGRIWVLMKQGDFGWIDPRTKSFTPCAPALRYYEIRSTRSICTDLEGNVWFQRSFLGGIMRWDLKKKRWDTYLMSENDPHGLGGVHTTFVTRDRSGNIWFGTNGDGLLRVTRSGRRFLSCTPQAGVPGGVSSSNVASVWKDREGALWVGTIANGLNYQPSGSRRFHTMRHDPLDRSSLPSNWVSCIRDRDRDNIWLGMVGGGGICVYSKRTRMFLRRSANGQELRNLGSDTVTAMHEDRSGTMWVGHYRGLDRYDDNAGTFRPVIRWPMETLGLMGSIGYMTEDDRGDLWLATVGRGLGRLDMKNGGVRWYYHDPHDSTSLPVNTIWCAFFDEGRRALWVPGAAGVLARYDYASDSFIVYRFSPSSENAMASTYGPSRALSDPSVEGIAGDARGNLWVSVGGNLVRFNPESRTCRWYGSADGITVAGVRRNAFLKATDGTIYLGGPGGLTWFHPDHMPENDVVPQVVLTRFAILGRELRLPNLGIHDIRLSHRENTFSLDFAALEFTNPEQNQFMYKLEGSGEEWVHLGTERRIRFANVSPGEYLLRVRASNNDGVWNTEGTALAIIIDPPFWETWWFRGFTIALLAAAGFGLYRYRISAVQEMERLRLRIADDLHDDIGSALSAVALESDLIARRLSSEPEEQKRIREVGRGVRSAADTLRDVVWIVNPEQEQLSDLVARLRGVARTMLRGINVTFTAPDGLPALALEMEFKRNVLLMYKEVLNNIARHARASRVVILIEETENMLHVCVRDNGIGFDRATRTDGQGLRSMGARAESIGGNLTIESTPGSGTTVCFRGTIPRS
jgi:signal transduction histidine kinase/streptogramin lyase